MRSYPNTDPGPQQASAQVSMSYVQSSCTVDQYHER